MRFQSVPHEIEAFQFTAGNVKPPKWFNDAYKEGRIQIIINPKQKHIAIYTKDGMRKAFIGDWVCRNLSGTIFPLTHEEMIRGFKPL